jgi:3-deoxy-D-manno-octulosonic-acid transferase
MRRLYTLLLRVLLPFAAAGAAVRSLARGESWRLTAERFGLGDPVPAGGIWVHAVSVGEVQAAAALVGALRERSTRPLTLTCATPTGRARASQALAADVHVRYAPYDLPGAVRRTLERLKPTLLIVLETELWPNLLHACAAARVPVMIASARVSARSARRYGRFPGLLRDALAAGVWVAAQSDVDAERFCELGVPASRVCVAGNVKFDREVSPAVRERGAQLRHRYAGYRPLWVAGSVHPGEIDAVIGAQLQLRQQASEPASAPVLVLAPRHPQRFEEAAAALARSGLRWARRSQEGRMAPNPQGTGDAAPTDIEVLLLDTLGELMDFYAAADLAFVGGSLVPVGGHNLLEPAALGLPVLSGPHQFNSPDVARLLTAEHALETVRTGAELAAAVAMLLADQAQRRQRGDAARAVIEGNRGAVERVLQQIRALLPA